MVVVAGESCRCVRTLSFVAVVAAHCSIAAAIALAETVPTVAVVAFAVERSVAVPVAKKAT